MSVFYVLKTCYKKICVTYLQFKNFCLYIDIHTQHTRTRHRVKAQEGYTPEC